ncbi:fimbrial chaperone [Salmonella enterica]|uniref:Fimbrial chaperone protein n=2 Tax=Salmonella enterica TaxID=28901 RepID=A0A447R8L3_SALER|nr:fimbrial biogenesis chaperone StbB [Salmonella enterica]EBH8947229.1 fimbrial chaperone [Salmonella enterica subsp. diarizonae serovar 48:i:z]ECG8606614.1 fimbrial chaperone [Salmonella enterica subsp. salamae]ECJ2283971.1 fimbrial chaperone [Salmonella enterica subsp. diarizonae]EDN2301496.1 fimbrial chaperone protein StbB [Salmonella enterica subsp. diarizonae serovar 65:(k):z]EGO1763625.1 fimbrial chaperone [Salmonella enterica subsp. diarizonae serovar Rough:-:-]VEA78641.1 fimbrial cha
MKMDTRHSGLCYLIVFLFLALPATASWASVTILGSRIIYPSTASSVDVQLKNNDAIPYIVQTWFDDGDMNTSPENSSAMPFIATPPVFRIQPKAGQVVRVIYNNTKKLPQDRESVFWFNVLQVPPTNIGSDSGQNKMLVMLRSRIKLFYRPDGLGKPDNLAKKLQIKTVNDGSGKSGIVIVNSQPWFASLSNLNVKANGASYNLDADMIAPFSSQTWWLPGKRSLKSFSGTVTVTLVNDLGARVSESYDVPHH